VQCLFIESLSRLSLPSPRRGAHWSWPEPIDADADAFIRGADLPNANYGDAEQLDIKRAQTGNTDEGNRLSYVRFAPSIPSEEAVT
jgi:hypothetical protein